jgi:hypothetical protein
MVKIIHYISNLRKSRSFRDIRRWIMLSKRTAEIFMLIDCLADSGTAEKYTADKRKMAISLQQKAISLLWYWETKSVIQVQRHYSLTHSLTDLSPT